MSGESSDPRAGNEHVNAFARTAAVVFARRLFAELVGTLGLVFVDCGGAVCAAMSGNEVTDGARSAATGLLVMAMVFAMGDVSGAHLNPAVTLAFALRRAFPWAHVPAYWLAQLAGAFVAVVLLRCLLGDVAHLGASVPGFGAARAFGMEVILSSLLVAVTLGTATRHRVLGPSAAIAAGGTVALCSLFSRPVSGASMNPARSLAPALISGATEDVWIYLTAPFLGAAVATGVMHVVHHRRHAEEREAAGGEKK